MHMEHALSAAPFMQVIDILRDDQQFARPFRIQPGESLMRRVWLHLAQRFAPHVVETQHEVGIARKTLWRGDVFHPVLLPQSAGIAERIDPTFSRYAGTGQDHDIANVTHLPHEARETEARQ